MGRYEDFESAVVEEVFLIGDNTGASGVELRADISIGFVFYQRLRRIVSHKYQVRTTGLVHNLTQ